MSNYSELDNCVFVVYAPDRKDLAEMLIDSLVDRGESVVTYTDLNSDFKFLINGQDSGIWGEPIWGVVNEVISRAKKVIVFFSPDFFKKGINRRICKYAVAVSKLLAIVERREDLPVIWVNIVPTIINDETFGLTLRLLLKALGS